VNLNSRSGRSSLDEVDAHILLKVEVGKNITLLELQERSKSRVGVDLTTISGVLEIVGSDVDIDFSGDISSGHLSSSRLAEESSKLSANLGGLNKSRRSAISTLLLSLSLGGRLKLLAIISLNGLEERLHLRELSSDLLKLSVELKASGLNIIGSLRGGLLSLRKGLNRHRNRLGRRGRGNGLNRLSLRLGLLGRLAGALLRSGSSHSWSRSSRHGGRRRRLGSLDLLGSLLRGLLGHFMIYTNTFFLSDLTHYILYP
jgi:hypothetical protein